MISFRREPRAAARDPYYDGYGQPAAADPVRDRYADYDAPPARKCSAQVLYTSLVGHKKM